jgi:poly(A) polymerase
MEKHAKALFIVKTLNEAGFTAYYAGGWVRDFLLNHPSDDIDIATNAPPEIIQKLFAHTIPIGLAFGIILVVIDNHQYEVATFRQDFDYTDGRRPSKIAFSSAEEDAKRRDFTINGMFYDPIKEKLLDYVEGQKDLQDKIIRAIGNPHQRIEEDRLRMVRAIRLSCRFHFTIEPETEKAIRFHARELFPSVAIERIVQELMKGLKTSHLACMLIQLHSFDLLPTIFPSLNQVPIEEIKHRIEPLQHYPRQAPLIAHLLPLFPELLFLEQIDLCKRLKISNADQQFVSLLFSARQLAQEKESQLFDWAQFYASPSAQLILQILKAHLKETEKSCFTQEHETRIQSLKRSIERLEKQDPVVKSHHLIAAGVQPSKTMGLLLAAAEKISINEQIESPELVIEKLKKLPLWPSN